MTEHRPFDARETLMCENSPAVPDSRWRTVSLVTAVRAIVAWSPVHRVGAWSLEVIASNPGTLLEAFQAATAELTHRGLDADSLVRYGIRNEIVGSLLGLLVLRDLKIDTPEMVHQRGIDLDEWSRVLPNKPQLDPEAEISADRIAGHASEMASAHVPLLLNWVMQAPLTSLVGLPAPSTEDLKMVTPAISSEERKLYEQYAWLVDRFSTTSLRDWLTSSLLYEYRWQAEQEPPPCSEELMSDREVGNAELNAEIARRTALNVPNGTPDPEAVLADDMAGHARVLLRQDRPSEAAALFEFAARRRPTDPVAHNNLGFCLIQTDPKRAMHELEAAARMGFSNRVVNVYNQVCCHLLQRRPRAALASAEEYWSAQDAHPGTATLWIWHTDGSWEIDEGTDPHQALAELAAEIARTEGLAEIEKRWRGRVESRDEGH